MLTGNKGEWSEVYVLFKLLSEKKLHAGDGDLNADPILVFDVKKIIRSESGKEITVNLKTNESTVSPGSITKTYDEEEVKRINKHLLYQIANSKSTFSEPKSEYLLNSIGCNSLKASSSQKTDIILVLYDPRNGITSKLGFSIKSQLGGASTLLNAGKTTNFVFRILNFNPSKDQLANINKKKLIKDRISLIKALGGTIQFERVDRDMFESNLRLIDSSLPEILSEILLAYYSSSESRVKKLVRSISKTNPLNFQSPSNHPFYEYKVKRLLVDIALGMMPSKEWTGKLDATGGYIVVKDDGQLLCYHIYNRNEFENYLFSNTKLETASTSRHEFGVITNEGGEFKIKLNLQIRFTY